MNKISLICLSFAGLTGMAYAADPEIPDMVGIWKPSAGVYARSGTEAKKSHLELSQQPIQGEIKILEQQGRTFHGMSKNSKGRLSLLTGVIAKDGKSFIISSDRAISTGTVEAGKIEYCGATPSLEVNFAFCSTLEKVK
ncbi:MAG: hypothetical protein RI949_717 [Pseudomonadota bacterium]|jgi:hypothetical protein|nr:hypothetical protein [Actinomycetota bacterium]